MRLLLWIAAAAALALWSLLAWAGHALVPAAAGLVGALPGWLGLDAAAAAPFAGAIGALVPVAEAAILVVWTLGALVILAAPWVAGRLARRLDRAGDGAVGLALAWIERRRRRRLGPYTGPARW